MSSRSRSWICLWLLVGLILVGLGLAEPVEAGQPATENRPDALYVGPALDRAVPGAFSMAQIGSNPRRLDFFTATLACADGSARQVLLHGRISRTGKVSGTSRTTTVSGRVGKHKIRGQVRDSRCGAARFALRRVQGIDTGAGGTYHGKSTATDPSGAPYGANLGLGTPGHPRLITVVVTSLACTVGNSEILEATGKSVHPSGAFAFREGHSIVAGRLLSHRHIEVVASDPRAGCRSDVAVIDLRRQR